jgi:uncharacterized membrane protein YfcA
MIDLLIGCVAGIFIGATGVGAGSILTPLLILRGHDPLTAVTTGLIALIAARAVGSLQHLISGHWPASHGSRVLIGGIAGAGLGFVAVQQMASRMAFGESSLRVTLGAVLLLIGLTGFVSGRLYARVPAAGPGIITLTAVGTGVAVATTSAGSGTLLGVLVYPATNWRVHEFSAVSNVFGLVTGLIGMAAYSRFGRFDASLLRYVMAGSVIGIVAGVVASRRIQRAPFTLALRAFTVVLGLGLIMV